MLRAPIIYGTRGAMVMFGWLLVSGLLRLNPTLALLASMIIPFLVGVAAAQAGLGNDPAPPTRQAVIGGGLAALITGAFGTLAGRVIIDYLVEQAIIMTMTQPAAMIPPEFYVLAYLLLGFLGGTVGVALIEYEHLRHDGGGLRSRR